MLLLVTSCAKIVVLEDPLSVSEHLDLGYLYEKQGSLDLAEKEYKKALKKDPKNFLALFNLGNVYAKKGDYTVAEKFYREALAVKEDPDVLNNLAYVLYKQGRREEALIFIKRALQMKNSETYRQTLREIEGH
ncbi:TPR repeat-containing protein [Thermocrinis albus DSM 14484]|uniref:TPR repeat-containing protein n=2 Tax=Thermocrinis TaxID=75905 RepID=D3SL19_THEAH|nr:TPR repeat-containing protein [Thermocrinis albus DSM 14484]